MRANCADKSSRGRVKKMKYSVRGYAGLVRRSEYVLKGWPRNHDIPFGNLSHVPGGEPIIGYLLALWKAGTLRFEPATEEDTDTARRNPRDILPGEPLPLRMPACWGPFGRNDMGKTRDATKKKQRQGPLTQKLILDEPIGDEDEVESDAGETEIETLVDSDPIELAVWSSDVEEVEEDVSEIEDFSD